MSYYTHHRHKDAGQYVHDDVLLCHTGDLNPYCTQHKHTDGPQHIHVDLHSEVSVRKKKNTFVKITNIKFHENVSVENLVTPTWEEKSIY
jgi:hypothetical protein